MAPTLFEVKLLIAPSEGNKSFMYVDTTGNVTVGIGNMLPSAAAAIKLNFVNRTTKNKASPAEIANDFDAVSKQPKAMAANYYQKFTNTDLPDGDIDSLFSDRVDEFQKALKKAYPKYDSYPKPVQLAILDMAFNLGVGALKSTVKWPKLNAAIAAQGWKKASEDCFRPDANGVRNAKIKALFLEGSK
jgi:GH24 family phage-related lysozyme (muramidase)